MDEFEGFVSAQGPALTRYAYLLCGDAPAAEDLTQSALIKALRHWERISGLEDPVMYVRRIVTREFLSVRRKRSASEVVVAKPQPGLTGGTVPDHADDVVESDYVWQALARLPKKQRAVLVMRYYLDLPFDDIGGFLNCSSGTARTHASRGLAALRQMETHKPEVSF